MIPQSLHMCLNPLYNKLVDRGQFNHWIVGSPVVKDSTLFYGDEGVLFRSGCV